jgi:hypothetical protein
VPRFQAAAGNATAHGPLWMSALPEEEKASHDIKANAHVREPARKRA